jgi:hypothetical protein
VADVAGGIGWEAVRCQVSGTWVVDDIFLWAFVAGRVREAVGGDDILLDNWDGEAPLLPLIQDILAHEADLIGDQRERILGYIGYEYLVDVGERG